MQQTKTKPTNSPWGPVQHRRKIAPGITRLDTASHGGIELSQERYDAMPQAYKDAAKYAGPLYFEEDCEWSIVALFYAEEFRAYHAENADQRHAEALACVVNHYPDAYEKHTGQKIKPGESRERTESEWYAAHADDWLVVSASGDWHDKVPAGMVGVIACKGGHRGDRKVKRAFLVPKDEYKASRYQFIVDLERHTEHPEFLT